MSGIDERSNKTLIVPGQANLAELAASVREAHQNVWRAQANAIEHALKAGEALTAAKATIPHRQFGAFLRSCDVGPRQGQRYMRLYQLAVGKNDLKSLLTGLSIEAAILLLSQSDSPQKPREHKPSEPKQSKPRKPAPGKTTHIDVLSAWINADAEARTKAINSIGLEPLLAIIPPAWWPLIERHIVDRRQPLVPSSAVTASPANLDIPDDLSISGFLRREQPKLLAPPVQPPAPAKRRREKYPKNEADLIGMDFEQVECGVYERRPSSNSAGAA